MRILIIILIVIAVSIAGIGLQMYFKNQKTPENLGVKNGKLAPMPSSPNAVSSQTEDDAKRVDPLPFQGSLANSKAAILRALEQYGDVEVIVESDTYIHAISTTKIMRYHDDLEFYFDESRQKVHFRSASRVGYSDMGLNRKRYNEIAQRYSNP